MDRAEAGQRLRSRQKRSRSQPLGRGVILLWPCCQRSSATQGKGEQNSGVADRNATARRSRAHSISIGIAEQGNPAVARRSSVCAAASSVGQNSNRVVQLTVYVHCPRSAPSELTFDGRCCISASSELRASLSVCAVHSLLMCVSSALELYLILVSAPSASAIRGRPIAPLSLISSEAVL